MAYRTMVNDGQAYNVEFFTGTEVVHLYAPGWWLMNRTIVENIAGELARRSEAYGLGYTVRVVSQSA